MKKKYLLLLALATIFPFPSSAKADFGDADFPLQMLKDGPKSYHDAWCRKIKRKCRVRFQGPAMWVEGQGGIQRAQFLGYRFDLDGDEFYNYISYKSNNGKDIRESLFLFANVSAHRDFQNALIRWTKLDPQPIPNYRLPASQGPQDTKGRDKGLNPYDNPPITDWSEKTTDEQDQRFRNKKPWQD